MKQAVWIAFALSTTIAGVTSAQNVHAGAAAWFSSNFELRRMTGVEFGGHHGALQLRAFEVKGTRATVDTPCSGLIPPTPACYAQDLEIRSALLGFELGRRSERTVGDRLSLHFTPALGMAILDVDKVRLSGETGAMSSRFFLGASLELGASVGLLLDGRMQLALSAAPTGWKRIGGSEEDGYIPVEQFNALRLGAGLAFTF